MKKEHNHSMHHEQAGNRKEYFKFLLVIIFILAGSVVARETLNIDFLDAFMGVFFVVFASFKLTHLKEFAYGFQSYDLLAKKSLSYSFAYPFIQLAIGVAYLSGFGMRSLDVFVVTLSLVSAGGVVNSLAKKQVVHCVCLGNVIKLSLSTISFVEDFGMAAMAIAMFFMR